MSILKDLVKVFNIDNNVNYDNKTILVTGGLGFIGVNFIRYINKYYKKLTIVNIDKEGVGSNDISSLKDDFLHLKDGEYVNTINDNKFINFKLDLSTDFEDLMGIPYTYDYVFHFAAESHVDRSISAPTSFISNNVVGLANLLEYIRVKSPNAVVVNVSTDEVYGHLTLEEDPFDTDRKLDPRSPYSASKASADLIANSYVKTYGMNIITTRCCNNFGPNQYDEKFIPTIVRNIIEGTPVPIYGSGTNVREWIFVDDHNIQLLKLAKEGTIGGVHHIGSGKELTNLELVSLISKILINYAPTFQFIEDRKGHDFRYALSVDEPIDISNFDDKLLETVRFYEAKYKND